MDLKDVRTTVDQNYHDMNMQPDLAEDVKKGKHLFMLFQKDLLPGVNGEILASKHHRDSRKVLTASPFTKLWGWILIVTLNITLLFYIYMFALGRTKARQGRI